LLGIFAIILGARIVLQSPAVFYEKAVMEGPDKFRLRIGGYRAVYELDNGRLIVIVFNVGTRGDIYK
jgi:mRNA-degrading endonuclease RelE of RelBE toxin-antitoxin system